MGVTKDQKAAMVLGSMKAQGARPASSEGYLH